MKNLKELIEDNYFVEVFEDPWDRLWITMDDQNKNIAIKKIDNQIWVSSGNESHICDCEETVLYLLFKYIKEKHKWGEFKNLN